jgi:hypothetical protein
MTAAERQRRRRELLQLGITHAWFASDQRAWNALEVIEAHLETFEPGNHTHTLALNVWLKGLNALLKRTLKRAERERRAKQ